MILSLKESLTIGMSFLKKYEISSLVIRGVIMWIVVETIFKIKGFLEDIILRWSLVEVEFGFILISMVL